MLPRLTPLLAAAGLSAAALALPAQATVFDFSYSFPTTDLADFPSGMTSATGKFTAYLVSPGNYLATDASGTWNGEAITGLSAVWSEGDNDNLIIPGSHEIVDNQGITFSVAGPIAGDAGAGVVNLYRVGGLYTDYGNDTGYSTNITLTQEADVPEPAAWAVMLLGFAMTGAAARRRGLTAAPHRGVRRPARATSPGGLPIWAHRAMWGRVECTRMIDALLVDDHPLFRDGFAAMLKHHRPALDFAHRLLLRRSP